MKVLGWELTIRKAKKMKVSGWELSIGTYQGICFGVRSYPEKTKIRLQSQNQQLQESMGNLEIASRKVQ